MNTSDEARSGTAAAFWMAIRQGNDYFNEGRYESAIQQYVAAWNIDYTSAIVNSNLASACFRLEQYVVGEICGILAFMHRGKWETGYIKSVICALGAGKVEAALKRMQSCLKRCDNSADTIILNELVEYYAIGEGKGRPFPLHHVVIKRLCNVDFKVNLDDLGPDTSVERMFSESTTELLVKSKKILDAVFMECRHAVPCDLMPIIQKCTQDSTCDLASQSANPSQPVKKETFCSHMLGDLEKRLLLLNQNRESISSQNPRVDPLVHICTKNFPKRLPTLKPTTLEAFKTKLSEMKRPVAALVADCKSLPSFGSNESVKMSTTTGVSEFRPALAIGHKKLPQKSDRSVQTNRPALAIDHKKLPQKFDRSVQTNRPAAQIVTECKSSAQPAETSKRTGETTIRKGPITSEDINSDLLLRLAEEDTSQVRKRLPVMQRSEDVLRYLHAGVSCLLEAHPCMALNHFKQAKQIMSDGQIDVNVIECDVTVVKYLLNLAAVRSNIYENVVSAVHCLRELEPCTIKLPAIYYLLGYAYCVLNRFKNAEEPLVKCEDLLEMHVPFPSHKWPGKELIIKETTREGLQEYISELKQRCRASHKPTAICRYDNCLTISTHIIPSENIFSTDLDFIGFVRVICEKKCRIEYHINCWKSYKDEKSDTIKITDKEMLGRPCLTADCNQSIIVTIEVIGEDGNLKTQKKLDPSANKATDSAQTKNSRKKKNKVMAENMKSSKMVKQKYRKVHSYEDDTTFEGCVNNNSSTVGGRIQGTALSDKLHLNLPALSACSVPSALDTSSEHTLTEEGAVCNTPPLNESNVSTTFQDDTPLVTPAELTCSVTNTLPDEAAVSATLSDESASGVSYTKLPDDSHHSFFTKLPDKSACGMPSTTLPVMSEAGNAPEAGDTLLHSVPGISSCNVQETDNFQCRYDSDKCMNTVTQYAGFIVKTFKIEDFLPTGIYFCDLDDKQTLDVVIANALTQMLEIVNVEGVEEDIGGTEEQKQGDDENKEINWSVSDNESNRVVVTFEGNAHKLVSAADAVNLPSFRINNGGDDSTDVTSDMVTHAYTNRSSSSDYNGVIKKKKTCRRSSATSSAGVQLVDSSVQYHLKMPEDETYIPLIHDVCTGEYKPYTVTVKAVAQRLGDNAASQIASTCASSYVYTSQDLHPTQATLTQRGVCQATMVSHQYNQQQLRQLYSRDQINMLQASSQNTAAANFFPQNTVFFETMSEQRGILPQPQLFRPICVDHCMQYFDQYRYMQNNGHNFVYSPQQYNFAGRVDLFSNQYPLLTNNYEEFSNYVLQASGHCNNGNIRNIMLENLGNQVVPFLEGRQQKRIQWIDGHSSPSVQQHYNQNVQSTNILQLGLNNTGNTDKRGYAFYSTDTETQGALCEQTMLQKVNNESGKNTSVHRGQTEIQALPEVEEKFLNQVNNQNKHNISVHSTGTETQVKCESEQNVSLQLVNEQETQALCDKQKMLQRQQANDQNAEVDLHETNAQNCDEQSATCNRDENLVDNQTDAGIASQDFEENSNDLLSQFVSRMQECIYKYVDMRNTCIEVIKLLPFVTIDDVPRIFVSEIQRAPHTDAMNIIEFLETFSALTPEEMKYASSQPHEKRLETQYISSIFRRFLAYIKTIYSPDIVQHVNRNMPSEAEVDDTISELEECVEQEYEKHLKKVIKEYWPRRNLKINAVRLSQQHLTDKSEEVAREIQRKVEIQDRIIREQKVKIRNCIISDCNFREQIYSSHLKLAVQRCFNNIDYLNQLLNANTQGIKEIPCWRIVEAKIDEWNNYFRICSKLEQEYEKTFKKCHNKIMSGQEATLPSTDLTALPPEPTPLDFSRILSEILDHEGNKSGIIRETCRHTILRHTTSAPVSANEVCVRKYVHIQEGTCDHKKGTCDHKKGTCDHQKGTCDHKKTEDDDKHIVPASSNEVSSVGLQYYKKNFLSIPKMPVRCSCGNVFELVFDKIIRPPYENKKPYLDLTEEEKASLLKVLPYVYRMISETPTIPPEMLLNLVTEPSTESPVLAPARVTEDTVPQKLSKAERKAAKRNKKVEQNEEERNLVQHVTRGAKENRSAVQQQRSDSEFLELSTIKSSSQTVKQKELQKGADLVAEKTTEKNSRELLAMESCDTGIRYKQRIASLSEHSMQECNSDKLTASTSLHVKSTTAASNDRSKAAAPSLESVLSKKAAVPTESLNTQEPPVTMKQTKKRKRNRKRTSVTTSPFQSETPEMTPYYQLVVTEETSHVSEEEQSLSAHDEEEGAPQVYIDKSEEEEEEEEWSTVKKKVPSKMNVVVPVPTEPRVKSFKMMLLNKLQTKYESKSVKELEDMIKLVRDQNGGSLSGLPIDEIVARVDHVFHERNLRKQSTMGLEKFKSTPWGKVKNEKPTCSWSGILLECAICLEPMKEDQTVLPCNHSFDTDCIRKWLREQSVCPLCKIFATMPDEFPAL